MTLATMPRACLLLALLLAAPAALAQPTPVPGGADVGPGALAFHDGRVTFVRTDPDNAAWLVRLDPATGRTTETALAAPGDSLLGWSLFPIAGRLYAQSLNDETYLPGPLLMIDPATSRPSPADPALSSLDGFDLFRLREVGPRTFASVMALDGETRALAEVGPDGRVIALEVPAPGERTPYYATPLGEAVYFAVEAPEGDDYVKTLWRAADGRAEPADVLPAGTPGSVSGLAPRDGGLLIAVSDRETWTSHLFRLAPGATHAVPVPAFEAPTDLGFELFLTVGDVLYLTHADDDRRMRLYRQTGDAPPVQVEGLDLGPPETFFADGVRVFDGALYTLAHGPEDDPFDTPKSLYRVDANGPARLVASLPGEDYPRMEKADERFVVAGGRLFVILSGDTDRLVSLLLIP